MTLAIGIKYPWGQLNRLIEPNKPIPGAIILASDSRWTYLERNSINAVSHDDFGTKLFQLGDDVGAVYAGVSEPGERCMDTLRDKLSQGNTPNSQNSVKLAQQTFEYIWKDYISSKEAGKIDQRYRCLYIVIGVCDKWGRTELYSFKHENDFVAEVMSMPKAIGIESQAHKLLKAIEDEMSKRVDEELSMKSRHSGAIAALASLGPIPPTFIEFSDVAFIVGHYLNSIILSGEDDSIGGNIQCAVITNQGFSIFPMSYTTDPTNEGTGWTRVTALPNQLKTLTGTFGCYSLVDFNDNLSDN